MKKVFSISMVLLVLTAMLHLTVATHYCGGDIAASKISLSGKLASCGMERAEENCPMQGNQMKSHCCDDVVSVYSIENNYAPSYSVQPEISKDNLQVFAIKTVLAAFSSPFFTFLNSDISPPGVLMSTEVDLSSICVFRI
jgi:hypothetical protein